MFKIVEICAVVQTKQLLLYLFYKLIHIINYPQIRGRAPVARLALSLYTPKSKIGALSLYAEEKD